MLSSAHEETLLELKPNLEPAIYNATTNDFEKQFQEANEKIFLKYKIRQSIEILEKANKLFNGNVAVAFSGGKDSLATLHLSLRVNPNIPVVFANTTVEFPETCLFVRKLTKEWRLNLTSTAPKKGFFHMVKEKGWAGHEDRWCCKPYKDEPAFNFLVTNRIKAEITGTTRTESIYRRSLVPFKMPKKEPYIMRINPIYDWNEWEVWAYIRQNSLPYNPLYNLGYRRIGCWCCPLNGWSHYRRLKKTHPHLYDFLSRFVPEHPGLQKLSIEESGLSSKRVYEKRPCRTEVGEKLVKTCDLFGHFYKDGFCFRCGKPASS